MVVEVRTPTDVGLVHGNLRPRLGSPRREPSWWGSSRQAGAWRSEPSLGSRKGNGIWASVANRLEPHIQRHVRHVTYPFRICARRHVRHVTYRLWTCALCQAGHVTYRLQTCVQRHVGHVTHSAGAVGLCPCPDDVRVGGVR